MIKFERIMTNKHLDNQATQTLFFKDLDILRFFAAIMVVISHAFAGYCGWFGIPKLLAEQSDPQKFSFAGKIVNQLIINGSFGVDLFFMISGFLITLILIKEKTSTGKVNIPKFFMRRAIRIWPLYYLFIMLGPLAIHLARSTASPHYLSNILFYNNFQAIHSVDPWGYPFAHLWSICVEEHFYLVWPIIIALIPMKYLKKVLFSLFALSLCFRLFLFMQDGDPVILYLHTFARIDVLIIGALYAVYFSEGSQKLILTKFQRLCLYLFFLLLASFVWVYEVKTIFQVIVYKYLFCVICGIGMIYFIFSPKRLIDIPFKSFWNYLGKISFGIYLFSNAIIPVIVHQFMYRFETKNIWLYFFLNVFLSICIAAIVYELYEKQFLKLKKYFEVVKTKRTA